MKYPFPIVKQIIFCVLAGLITLILSITSIQNLALTMIGIMISLVLLLKGSVLFIHLKYGLYISLEGTCTRVEKKHLQREQEITVEDGDENEYIFSLPLKVKIKVNERYRFFFTGKVEGGQTMLHTLISFELIK